MFPSSRTQNISILLALPFLVLSPFNVAAKGPRHEEYEPKPKMIAEAVYPGKPFLQNNYNSDEETIHSSSATFIGTCSESSPFEFFLGTGSGRGVIGTVSSPKIRETKKKSSGGGIRAQKEHTVRGIVKHITFSDYFELESGEITLENEGKADPNFFAVEGLSEEEMESYVGTPFSYRDVVIDDQSSSLGASVKVYCSEPKPSKVVVLFKNDGKEEVKASLSIMSDGISQLLQLEEKVESKAVLKRESLDVDTSNDEMKIALSSSSSYSSSSATTSTLVLTNEDGDDVETASIRTSSKKGKKRPKFSLVQALIVGDGEDIVPRTLFVKNKDPSPPTVPIKIEESDINDNGDIVLTFNVADFPQSESIKISARIGINVECTDAIIEVVDESAMLSSSNPTMIVHGGWFRKAIKDNDVTCENWEPIILQASAVDPNNNYEQVASLDKVAKTDVMKGNDKRDLLGKNDSGRRLLRAEPSTEELNVSLEMSQGRRPSSDLLYSEGGKVRSLVSSSSAHKKILVHGYCGTSNPFPISHFSNAIAFRDPNNYSSGSNFSIDQFARKIDQFADDQGISGCGIIGHSQGGLAALHLYTNYWSCLDYTNTGGNALIQSVGSPYQGSVLSGGLADVGDIFGVGCGANNDLTEAGASSWLSGIPSWARSKVHYYTTSFTDKWWRWDYCNLGSEVLLSDPEDGAVEKQRGYLPGGNYKNHRSGQCHTTGMRDPPQTENYSRNREMNTNAKY